MDFIERGLVVRKTVILLGTAHRVQGAERGICNIEDPDYETLVDQLWLEYAVDFVFEEASGLGPTFAEKFALANIGPHRYKDKIEVYRKPKCAEAYATLSARTTRAVRRCNDWAPSGEGDHEARLELWCQFWCQFS